MKKSSNVKKTLIFSVSALFLSVSMLGGATFAYFTDSVDNSSNVIKAGTLELDFKHLSGGDWISVKDQPNHQVFGTTSFEPGLTTCDKLKIENEGNLTFKYALNGAVALNTADVGRYGQRVSDVIDVFVSFKENAELTTDLRDDTVWNYAGTLSKVFDSKDMFSGVLLPKGEDFTGKYLNEYNAAVGETTITVAMRMKENIGHAYQGMKLGKLNLTLNATQYMYEKDAYNSENYDKVPYEPLMFNDGMTHEVAQTVIFDENTEATDVITASGKGTIVNITGGYYDSAAKECAIWAKDEAVVNIYGGTYICDGYGTATSANHQDLIYAGSNEGTINIYGGRFECKDPDGAWLLNEKDNQGRIKVYGGEFVNWNPANNVSEGANTNFLASGTAILEYKEGEDTIYKVIDKDWLVQEDTENVFNLIGSATVMDDSAFWKISKDDGFTFNGNGQTITSVVYDDNPLYWELNGFVPALSPTFSTSSGALVTVNDVTFTGTGYGVLIGHDSRNNKFPDGTYWHGDLHADRGIQNSVVNNLKVIDLQAFSFSIVGACGLATFGTGTYNNVVCTGTTRHPNDSWSATRVIDVIAANHSKNTYNDCTFGSFYSQTGVENKFYRCKIDFLHLSSQYASYSIVGAGCEINELLLGGGYLKPDGSIEDKIYHTGVTIQSGATVNVLDLSKLTTFANVKIEDGAVVKKFRYNEVDYATFDEAKAALQANNQ